MKQNCLAPNGQISIWDYLGEISEHKYYGDPDYGGALDEILRMDIENKFELEIPLDECHGEPKKMFRSCREYFIICPVCGKRTQYWKHLYQAMQAWNRGERGC